jgi:HEPN domain-containing protein
MNGPAELAKGWIAKADSDLATADLVVKGSGPFDTACYHAQQAIEKCLKAVLALTGAAIPRTHNLEELGDRVTEAMPTLALDADELAEITPFAVELRYDPDFWPDLETAKKAFSAAQRLREQIVAALPESARP